MKRLGCVLLLALTAGLTASSAQAADQTLRLLYSNRAPYLHRADDAASPVGALAKMTEGILARTGIRYEWLGPLTRPHVWDELLGHQPACSPNMLRTAGRAALYKFSIVMTEVPPDWGVLTLPGADRVKAHSSFLKLLQDEQRSGGFIKGAVISKEINEFMAENATNARLVRGSAADLINMLLSRKIDYMVVPVDDLDFLRNSLGSVSGGEFDVTKFADLRQDDGGRFVCSQAVSDEMIERINAAIASYWDDRKAKAVK